MSSAAIAALLYSSVTPADCGFQSASSYTHYIDFGKNLPSTGLEVPLNTAIGTIVYREQSAPIKQDNFQCNTTESFGIFLNTTLGTVSGGFIFPLGKTGLSFRLTGPSRGGQYLAAPHKISPGKYNLSAGAYIIEIIKTGDPSSQTVVPAGFLANYRAGRLTFARFNLTRPISVQSPLTCFISDSIDLRHGDLSMEAVDGNRASTLAYVSCSRRATVTVAIAPNTQGSVQLSGISGLYSELSVNGTGGGKAVSISVGPASQPLDIQSVLRTDGAITAGAFRGSSYAILSIP